MIGGRMRVESLNLDHNIVKSNMNKWQILDDFSCTRKRFVHLSSFSMLLITRIWVKYNCENLLGTMIKWMFLYTLKVQGTTSVILFICNISIVQAYPTTELREWECLPQMLWLVFIKQTIYFKVSKCKCWPVLWTLLFSSSQSPNNNLSLWYHQSWEHVGKQLRCGHQCSSLAFVGAFLNNEKPYK